MVATDTKLFHFEFLIASYVGTGLLSLIRTQQDQY
jgi:hypothetical protein